MADYHGDGEGFIERRQNAGIVFNGAAKAEMERQGDRIRADVKSDMLLQSTTMRKDFYRACFLGVIMVFMGCVSVAWVASKQDSRIVNLEGMDTRLDVKLEKIDRRLRGIERKLPGLVIGTPDGWDDRLKYDD